MLATIASCAVTGHNRGSCGRTNAPVSPYSAAAVAAALCRDNERFTGRVGFSSVVGDCYRKKGIVVRPDNHNRAIDTPHPLTGLVERKDAEV